MVTKAQLEAQYKYDKKNTQQVILKLNKATDSDILSRLFAEDNKQGYIKRLIREDMRDINGVLSIESIKSLLLPIVERYQIKTVSIFGSYARNEATSKSDVDLVVGDGNYHGLKYIDLINEMQEALGREVDVITEKSLLKSKSRGEIYFREMVERDRIRLI